MTVGVLPVSRTAGQTEAQKRQVEINIIMSLQAMIDDDTRLQLIAEQLELDFEELKDKQPNPEADLYAQPVAPTVPTEPTGGEGDMIV